MGTAGSISRQSQSQQPRARQTSGRKHGHGSPFHMEDAFDLGTLRDFVDGIDLTMKQIHP